MGLYYGNPALTILLSSVGVAIAAYIVGTIIGAIAQHAIDEHIRQHKYNSPIPGEGIPANDERNDNPMGSAAAPPG